jgi:hypothetical protein
VIEVLLLNQTVVVPRSGHARLAHELPLRNRQGAGNNNTEAGD